MAVSPTFAPSLDALKSSLRLSAVASGDALSIIEDAVREVRLGFVRRLGSVRVAQLVGFAYDPSTGPPDTNDEILRESANVTELLWTRKLLLERLPTIFRDSSGDAALTWQTDGMTRETEDEQRRRMVEELCRQIEEHLEFLAGVDVEETTIAATTFSPENPPLMGASSTDSSGEHHFDTE